MDVERKRERGSEKRNCKNKNEEKRPKGGFDAVHTATVSQQTDRQTDVEKERQLQPFYATGTQPSRRVLCCSSHARFNRRVRAQGMSQHSGPINQPQKQRKAKGVHSVETPTLRSAL